MAEGARLESVFTGNRNVGSNPTPSAKPLVAFCPDLYRSQDSAESPLHIAYTSLSAAKRISGFKVASERSGDGDGRTKHDLGSPDDVLFFGVFRYVVAAAPDAWDKQHRRRNISR